MTETLAHGGSSESTPQELSNEYQYDGVKMVFTNLCILVLWTEVAIALEGLTLSCWYSLGSPHRVLSGEYPHARISVLYQDFCIYICFGQFSHQQHKG